MAQGTTKGVPIDVDPLLDLDSDLVVPSQKAIKAYVDAKQSQADSDYVNVSGDTMTGYLLLHADPSTNLHAVTKQYVDNYINGLDYKTAAHVGTVSPLPAYTVSVNKLVLTGTSNGAISTAITDNHAPLAGERVLVKNETSTLTPNNGIYVLTQVGDGSNPFILTRADDANTSAELGEATLSIIYGSTLANTIWHCTPASVPITLGTTGLTFIQVGSGSVGTGVANELTYWASTSSLGSLTGNITTTKKFLSQTGDGTITSSPVWGTLTSSDVGLGNVENTALSTWAGSANITTLGTITTGTWSAGTIAVARGGTGLTTIAAKSILVANSLDTYTTLTPGAGQSVRINAANNAWEVFTPGTGQGVTNVQTFSGSSQPNGATISTVNITFGPADATNPGMVSTGAQTWAGLKTFNTFTSYGSAQTQAAPTITTSRSAGSRVLIHEAFSASTSTDYAIGTESNAMWYSIPQATSTFSYRWYGGATNIMHLSGNGILNLTNSATGAGAGTAFPAIRSSLSATQSTGNRLTVLSSFFTARPVVDLGIGVSLSTTAANNSPTYFPTISAFTNNSLNFVSGSTTSTSANSLPGSFHFLTPEYASNSMTSTSNVGFGAGVLPPLVTFRRTSLANTLSTSAIILSAPRGIGTSAISNMTGNGTIVTITLAAGAVSTTGLAINQYIYVSGSTPAEWDSVAGHITTVVEDVITVASTVNPGSFTSATLNYIYRSDSTSNYANVFLAFDKDRESAISAAGANLFYPNETRVLWFTKGNAQAGGANGIYALLTNNLYFISTNENDSRPKLTERITFGAHSTNIGIAENVTTGSTLNIGTGVTASGSTKTINIGTLGASGSTTAITIGSTAGTVNTIIRGNLTLGTSGGNMGFYGTAASSKPTVSGSKASNAALTSLCTALATLGLITNSTT